MGTIGAIDDTIEAASERIAIDKLALAIERDARRLKEAELTLALFKTAPDDIEGICRATERRDEAANAVIEMCLQLKRELDADKRESNRKQPTDGPDRTLTCPECGAEVTDNIVCDSCGLYFVTPDSWPNPTKEFVSHNAAFFEENQLQWV